MRRILIIAAAATVAVVGGYGLYWHAAAGTLARGIDDWARQQREAGFEIAFATPEVGGFPFRLEAILAEPTIGAPTRDVTRWRWAGPTLTLHTRPWAPLDAEALAPGRHRIELDAGGAWRRFTVDAGQASGRASFATDGRLTRAEIALADLIVVEDGAEDRPLAAETAALLLTPGAPGAAEADDHARASLELQLALSNLLLPPESTTPLGRTLETLEVDAAVMGRIDTARATLPEALARWRDDGGTLDLARVVGRWGPLHLTGEGTFALDGALQPIGAMSTAVSGHAAAIDALVGAGMVTPRDGGLAKILLAVLAKPSPVDGTPELVVPLTLQDGWLWAGPAKLVRLPVIRWE